MKPMKINMACGWRDFGKDWIHIDGGDYPHLDSYDITKLEYEDNTISLIYCSHAIEYFDREEIKPILAEWRRVLAPNGILRLAVPDFKVMNKLYSKGLSLQYFLGPLYGRMPMSNQTIYHKTTYDFDSLALLLSTAGFKSIKRYNWQETEHAKFDDHSQAYIPHMDKENGTLISLNVECIKGE